MDEPAVSCSYKMVRRAGLPGGGVTQGPATVLCPLSSLPLLSPSFPKGHHEEESDSVLAGPRGAGEDSDTTLARSWFPVYT